MLEVLSGIEKSGGKIIFANTDGVAFVLKRDAIWGLESFRYALNSRLKMEINFKELKSLAIAN